MMTWQAVFLRRDPALGLGEVSAKLEVPVGRLPGPFSQWIDGSGEILSQLAESCSAVRHVLAGAGLLRTSTDVVFRRTESARLYEYSP